MAIEVEVKAYAKNLKGIKEKILGMGAEPTWQGDQIDTYYNHPSRNFGSTDEALRIREEDGKAILTYKGPKIDKLSKTREEIKVQVGDVHAIKDLLKKLGFRESGMVRKHRAKFFLGRFKICLDEVENLGQFVEIESSVNTEDSDSRVAELRDSILKTFGTLGLKDTERRSYLELLYPDLTKNE